MKLVTYFLNTIFALIAICASSFLAKALCTVIWQENPIEKFWFFATGAIICLLLFPVFKNKWLYVFAHESAHWITAKLYRRRTGKFKITSTDGHIEIENPNLAITLAPYFLPTLCLLWLPFYPIALYVIKPTGWNEQVFFAILGYWTSHHLLHTFKALHKEQPDLIRHGYFFSMSLIIFCNMTLATLLYPLFTKETTHSYQTITKTLISDFSRVINLFIEKSK